MSFGFTDGAYNLASGTRNAFGALSADLVAEGLPPMVSGSGDRERADQERIWNERMTLTPGTRKTYGYRWWQGKKWWQIHPDTVAPPGTGNHEARRSNDLKWPYNSDTTAARRAKELAKRHNITREGEKFRELWHWTFWGPLGTIGTPAPAGAATTPPQEEDELMKIITWNGAVWLVWPGGCSYLPSEVALWAAKKVTKQAIPVDLSNDELTETLFFLAIPWGALDAAFKGRAFDNESNWGHGHHWSREMAEGREDALRDASLAQSIDELAKSVAQAS